jgi:hypothetical protein
MSPDLTDFFKKCELPELVTVKRRLGKEGAVKSYDEGKTHGGMECKGGKSLGVNEVKPLTLVKSEYLPVQTRKKKRGISCGKGLRDIMDVHPFNIILAPTVRVSRGEEKDMASAQGKSSRKVPRMCLKTASPVNGEGTG